MYASVILYNVWKIWEPIITIQDDNYWAEGQQKLPQTLQERLKWRQNDILLELSVLLAFLALVTEVNA